MRQFELAIYKEDKEGNAALFDEEFFQHYFDARKRAEKLSRTSSMVFITSVVIDENPIEIDGASYYRNEEWQEKYMDGSQVQIMPKVWRYGAAIYNAIGSFADNERLKRISGKKHVSRLKIIA